MAITIRPHFYDERLEKTFVHDSVRSFCDSYNEHANSTDWPAMRFEFNCWKDGFEQDLDLQIMREDAKVLELLDLLGIETARELGDLIEVEDY